MQQLNSLDDAVREKTLELCGLIVRHPQFQEILKRVEAFMADPAAQQQYQSLSEKGRALHERQEKGMPLDDGDIAAFDAERDAFLGNPVAKGFLEAQNEMHDLQHGVQRVVNRTFELGRVPAQEDLQDCGGGCSCHH